MSSQTERLWAFGLGCRFATVGAAQHGCVQAETIDVGAQRVLEVRLPGHCTLQRQRLAASARAECDAVSARLGLQRLERAGFVRIAVVVGHVGRTRRTLCCRNALQSGATKKHRQ